MIYDILLYLAVILFVVWLATPAVGWRVLAWAVSRPAIARWLIQRAKRTPYTHIPGYMNRYWLLNAYESRRYIRWLPSVRVHHILRRDNDRHKHDHPWDARTVVLHGHYEEAKIINHGFDGIGYFEQYDYNRREAGDTAPILYGNYHSITEVSEGGVWTLFITFGYRGPWGFLVDGVKVPWREYMAMYPEKPWASEEPTP